jgi:hypothetical protein
MLEEAPQGNSCGAFSFFIPKPAGLRPLRIGFHLLSQQLPCKIARAVFEPPLNGKK